MNTGFFATLAVLAACLPVSLAGQDILPAPITPHVAYRPTFLTSEFSHTNGMAFIARLQPGGQAYLLSCHHVFGPFGGLEIQLSSDDISRIFVGAAAVSMSDRSLMVTAHPYILLKDARVSDAEGSDKDIAIFRMNAWVAGPSLILAPRNAIKGTPAWVLMKDPEGPLLKLMRATVVLSTANQLRYFLEDQTLDMSRTSGAPVVSLTGAVIGMHAGMVRTDDGRRLGFAVPVSALRDALVESDPLAVTAPFMNARPLPQVAPPVDQPVVAPPQTRFSQPIQPPAVSPEASPRVEPSAANPSTREESRPARPAPPTRPRG